MAEDVGGTPFPDGEDHGADEEFASVVFDEAFIRAAAFREPSARERLLAAARARAAAEAARARVGGSDDDPDDAFPGRRAGFPGADLGLYGGHYRVRRGLGHTGWHRTIAWLLALIMGLGVVALTFSAVYRGASGAARHHAPGPPPATGLVGVSHPPVAVPAPSGG
jgi:hypothetical protein